MAEVKIVKLDASTVDLLGAVGPDVFDDAVLPGQAARLVGDPAHLMMLAIYEGEVVGFASGAMQLHPDKAPTLFLSEIGTVAAHQRKGIATRLVKALTELAQINGCTSVWLATEEENIAARCFYRALGASETQGVVLYNWDLEA